MNYFRQKLYRKAQHTFYVQFIPPWQSRAGYKVIWKNMV